MCRRIEILGSAVKGIFGSAVRGVLGWAVQPANFVAGRSVGYMIAIGSPASRARVFVALDRILGYHHKDTAVHSLHCSRAQYDMVRKTGIAGFLFHFSLQEVLLCRLLWIERTRNRLPHMATNNGWKNTKGISRDMREKGRGT